MNTHLPTAECYIDDITVSSWWCSHVSLVCCN